MDGSGQAIIAHLSGYPNTSDDTRDAQDNRCIQPGQMLMQVGELQPWIVPPLCHVRITTGGLYYCGSAKSPAAVPSITVNAISALAYLAAYGPDMGPSILNS